MIVPNVGSKVHGKAIVSIFLRLRQVKPRTGHTKSVHRRSKERGSPGRCHLQPGIRRTKGDGMGGMEPRESRVCSGNRKKFSVSGSVSAETDAPKS